MAKSVANEIKKGSCRRSNGRSISGCLACRRKRIKCDESRPHCLNCKQSSSCIYGTLDPAKEWRRKILTFSISSQPVHQAIMLASGSNSSSVRGDPSLQEAQQDGRNNTSISLPTLTTNPSSVSEGYGIRDVQLLKHFVTSTAHSIIGRKEEWTTEGVQLAFTNDFLLHAILMTAASHLQRLNPGCGDDYALQSAYHLRLSLHSFRIYLSNHAFISSNVDAVIATCFLFIIYSYNSPVFEPEARVLDPLLCHSSGVFDILRRQRSLVLPSIFRPICMPQLLPAVLPKSGPASDLILMVTSFKPNSICPDPNEKVYIATIKNLTLVLETVTTRPPLGNTPPQSLLLYLVKWLSFLPIQFTNLINSHDPRALVIIAHYYATVAFVLSQAKTAWWWMRERPVYMIQQIMAFLGKEWDIWMQWPNEVVEMLQFVSQRRGVYALGDGGDSASTDEIVTQGVLSEAQLHYSRMEVGE